MKATSPNLKLLRSPIRTCFSITTATLFFSEVYAGVLITEVDNDTDYVEITNTSTVALDISGWTLNVQDDDFVNWSFTLGTGSVLAAGESFGVSDEAYFGAVVSTENIPNFNARGALVYVTDDSDILQDALAIVAGTDTGGTPPLNFPDFLGTIDWTSGDAVVRTSNERFTSNSFVIGSASPVTSTTLSGTSATTITPIAGVSAIPEASSVSLLGLVGISFLVRRRRKG